MKLMEKAQATVVALQNKVQAKMRSERGGIAGYGVAWMMGVPLSLLVVIYLFRHH